MEQSPLVVVKLSPLSRVAVGDVVRYGEEPHDLGCVTQVLHDGKGPLFGYRHADGTPQIARVHDPVVVGVTHLAPHAARREYALEAARRVVRRLNRANGYDS